MLFRVVYLTALQFANDKHSQWLQDCITKSSASLRYLISNIIFANKYFCQYADVISMNHVGKICRPINMQTNQYYIHSQLSSQPVCAPYI